MNKSLEQYMPDGSKVPYRFMKYRIHKILLVCCSYDGYILEEDGHIESQINQEYIDLNMSNPPSLTRVSSTAEALEALDRDDSFDFILTMYNVGEPDVFSFAKIVKERHPNTPVALGDGMIQYCSDDVEPEKMAEWLAAMAPAGRLDAVPEGMMDAASAVSGCGPAWAYQFIEALADGGVAAGLPRAKAQEYAAQMLLGSARMVLETGKHPGELKDAVCSPGGSTIQGVRVLEERGFRGAVTDAVLAAYDKTKEMGKG